MLTLILLNGYHLLLRRLGVFYLEHPMFFRLCTVACTTHTHTHTRILEHTQAVKITSMNLTEYTTAYDTDCAYPSTPSYKKHFGHRCLQHSSRRFRTMPKFQDTKRLLLPCFWLRNVLQSSTEHINECSLMELSGRAFSGDSSRLCFLIVDNFR